MLGPKCSDSYARSSWWPARTDCFLHPPLLLLCDFSRILPAFKRASMSERGCEVPSWWLALNSCNDFIHHMESHSALLSYQSDVSKGGCRNQGGKKNPRPHLTSAASLFPQRTDREGQVEGETAWGQAGALGSVLRWLSGSKGSVDGFACCPFCFYAMDYLSLPSPWPV